MKIVPQHVELLRFTQDATGIMEEAGRTCRKSDCGVGTAAKFIRGLFKSGHHTILEHASATFRVTCSRGVSHEFVRHRIMVFSQESTRYCDYTKDKHDNEIKVVCPPFENEEDRADFIAACEESERRYRSMRARGCKPELARGCLPTDLKTEFVVTANLREWCLFLRQRYYGLTGRPHPQMLEVATEIRRLLMQACPEVFELLDREARCLTLTDKLIGLIKGLRDNRDDPGQFVDELCGVYDEYEKSV
jgi:thymidylate synthase (FAD)